MVSRAFTISHSLLFWGGRVGCCFWIFKISHLHGFLGVREEGLLPGTVLQGCLYQAPTVPSRSSGRWKPRTQTFLSAHCEKPSFSPSPSALPGRKTDAAWLRLCGHCSFLSIHRAETAVRETTTPRMLRCYGIRAGQSTDELQPTLRSGLLSRASVNTARSCHGGGGGGGGSGEGRRCGPPPGSALPFLNWSLVPVTVASGNRTVRREEAVRTISPSSPGAGPGRTRPAEPGEGRPVCRDGWQ